MSSAGKAVSVITTAEAEQTAQEFLSRFAAPAEAGALVEEFCQRYSWAARRDVLDKMAAELSRRDVDLPAESWHRFLTFSAEGVKSHKVAEHLALVLKVALATSKEHGAALAGRLLFDQLQPPPEGHDLAGYLGLEDGHLGVLDRLTGAAAVVTSALRQAKESGGLDQKFLARWQRALALVIGRSAATRGRCLSADQASEVLNLLGRLEPVALPDELLLFCPRLLALASHGITGQFLDTATGKVVRQLLPAAALPPEPQPAPVPAVSPATPEGGPTPVPQAHAPPSASAAEWEVALWKARDLIVAEFHRLGQGVAAQKELAATREKLGTTEEELRESGESLRRTEKELDRARDCLRELRTRAEELESENQEKSQKLRAAEEKVARWQDEVRRREDELRAGFADEERRQVESLRRMLSGTTRDLCGYVQDVLTVHRGDNLVRQMGVTFDQLHRDLLTVLQQPNEQRLPRELLARINQETPRHE
jgi:hypothetical protein